MNPLCPKFISNKGVFGDIGSLNFRSFTVAVKFSDRFLPLLAIQETRALQTMWRYSDQIAV